MIRKTDSSLLNWIYKHVVDFTDENDKSGLTWNSTNDEALRFMNWIPKKVKVQKYGVYAGKSYLFVVDEFDDLEEGLKRGLISEKTCRLIHTWNKVNDYNEFKNEVQSLIYRKRWFSSNYL